MTSGTVGFITANTFEFDSRHRRAADALAGDGWDVVVVAMARDGLPEVERLPSGVVVRRPRVDRRVVAGVPGPLRRPVAALAGLSRDAEQLPRDGDRARAPVRRGLEILSYARRVGPWATAALAAAPAARIWVAKALVALPVAVEAAARSEGRYVYDVADLHVESGRLASLPGPLKARLRSREAGWVRGAAALLASTPAMADEVARRFGRARPTPILNVRERWHPDRDVPRPTRLRRTIGIGGQRQVIIYQGAFRPDQGIETLFDALADGAIASRPVSAAFLGFGPLEDRLRAAARSHPERVSVLPPVPSDELLEWTAGADVAFVGAPPVTVNQTLTSPNKLFEAAMAGVPVIVADGTFTARLVREHGLGDVVDPWTPRAVAQAIGRQLSAPASERLARRRAIRRVALERLNWEVEREALLDVFRTLA